jgi:hypothetical protein
MLLGRFAVAPSLVSAELIRQSLVYVFDDIDDWVSADLAIQIVCPFLAC